jgi:predicted TIM-barrel fold metal-dependent hydrolase
MADQELKGAYDEVEVEDTLLLKDFEPKTMLRQKINIPQRPKFPTVDAHVHFDEVKGMTAEKYLKLMDEAGIEACVTLTWLPIEEVPGYIKRFSGTYPDRFKVVIWNHLEELERTGKSDHFLDWMKRLNDMGLAGFKFWKDMGLTAKNPEGTLWRIDDERLDPVYALAGELNMPFIFHTTDPDAFFIPLDRFNERYEELIRHPDWAFNDPSRHPKKEDVLAQQENVFKRHPGTRFWAAHCAARGENLPELRRLLETYPNFHCDISSRINELGRQPWTSRELLTEFADRIAFGSDMDPELEMYQLCWRFFETRDEYWDYPSHPSRQGRWKIHSLDLSDETLKKFYHDTAWNFYWNG